MDKISGISMSILKKIIYFSMFRKVWRGYVGEDGGVVDTVVEKEGDYERGGEGEAVGGFQGLLLDSATSAANSAVCLGFKLVVANLEFGLD